MLLTWGSNRGDAAARLLSEAVFLIDPGNLTADASAIGNANSAIPVRANLLTFTSQDIRGQGVTNLTVTRGAVDTPLYPGELTGARVQATAIGALFNLWTSSTPPAGSYRVKFNIRSHVGAGNQNIRYGASGSLSASTPITEGAWLEITASITATGIGTNNDNFAITDNGTTLDYDVGDIRFYEGTGVGPVAVDEVYGAHYRRTPAYDNTITVTNGVVAFATSGGLIPMPEFRGAGKAFTEFTLLIAFRQTNTSGSLFSCDADGTNSSATLSLTANATDGLTTLPIGNQPTIALVKPKNTGIQFAGLRLAAGARDSLFHEIALNHDTTAWAGMTVRAFRMGSYSATIVPNQTGALFPDGFAIAAGWNRALSDDEVATALGAMRSRVTANGGTLGDFARFWLAEGDSITATASTPYFFRLAGDGAVFTPMLWGKCVAVAGTTLAQIIARSPQIQAMCRQTVRNGRKCLYTLLTGANDTALLIASGAASYYATLKAHMLSMKATGAITIWIPMLPADVVGIEAPRAALIALAKADGVAFADYITDDSNALIYADGAPAARTYYTDNLHPNALGQVELAAAVKPTLTLAMA